MSEPIRKTIEVPASAEAAFHAWAGEIGRWWPLRTHAVGDAIDCRIEHHHGGRVHEITADGTEHLWGTVTVFGPPHRLAHSWHPGREAGDATLIEVRFTDIADGRCRVELVHDGWRPGDEARRADYDLGWEGVLRDGYAAHVAATVASGAGGR